jgi:predicted outer membrane repeat protein
MISKMIALFIGLAILCLMPIHNAQAATFSVCTLAELTSAITNANLNNQPDTILFNCSTTLNFSGTLSILDDGPGNDIIISNNGNSVTFDGGSTTSFFTVYPDAELSLNGILFQFGSVANGGALSNRGTLNITNSIFTNNTASSRGGVLYNLNSSATLTITNSQFTNNSASNGGVISNNGGYITITDSIFMNNSATSYGGAIESFNGSTIVITNGTFIGNSAGLSGGAIIHSDITSHMTISNSLFQNNTASGGGGAIANSSIASSQNTDYVNNDCTGAYFNLGGNLVSSAPGCPGSPATMLDVSPLTCSGDSAVFTINAGDANFNIEGTGPGLDILNAAAGLYGLVGPCTWTSVTITELRGDREVVFIGSISCPVSNVLNAVATCVGDNLQVSILSGDPAFTVYADSGTLFVSVPLGTYTAPGPNTWTNLTVLELMGDMQVLNLGNITCGGGASAPLVLGCTLDAPNGVTLADAPDNTYCRVLMRNGNVTEFSGAIPANLMSLGVKLAVDVYRLEGGRSITEFPNYARVCLAGKGRLFYMDSRQAPRIPLELPTETVGDLTCGWIPAPGTLILTN